MKVVIAIDSFKGSLSSTEAGNAASEGIRNVCDARIIVKSVADGGEGTTEALMDGLGGEYVYLDVTGPSGKKVSAKYGILRNNRTAVIEMAQAAGITLLKDKKRNPMTATTYGVGEMILDAVKRGCRNFIIGIGGSATTDGGVGMLQALGYEFIDKNGHSIGPGIEHLNEIEYISEKKVNKIIKKCHFQVACDVKNPLYGKNGAVYVYGSQKGIKEEEKDLLDKKMIHYAQKTKEYIGNDYSSKEGAGAAGGLGFAFISYLPYAELKSGIDIILDAVELEEEIKDADIVITGEGRIDGQTVMGKLPAGIANIARKYGVKVIAVAGSVADDAYECNEIGISAIFSIINEPVTLENAMIAENAKRNIKLTVEQIFRLL